MDAHRPDEQCSVAAATEPCVSDPALASPDEAYTFRDLSPRWLKVWRIVSMVWFYLTYIPALVLLFGMSKHGSVRGFFAVCAVVAVSFVLTLSLHEAGHWLAARCNGMTVLRVRFGPIEIQPLRGGLRWRRQPGKRASGVYGSVYAIADPARSSRAGRVIFILAGPLTNLVLAAIAFAIAGSLPLSPARTLGWVIGLLNLYFAIANLLPLKFGTQPSDGLNLLYLLRNPHQRLPGAAYMDLVGRLLRGDSYAQLPADSMRRLAQEPMPMPAMHDSFRCAIAMQAGDWREAVRIAQELEAKVAASDDAMQAELVDLSRLNRAEMAFCQAMIDAQPAPLEALDLEADVFWFAPSLASRLRGLAAALRGDVANARRWLALAQQHADRSVNASLRAAEAHLCSKVEQVINRAQAASVTETQHRAG